MMNIPGYDAWRLAGPDEAPEPEMVDCGQCDGTGTHLRDEHDTGVKCHVCRGEGVVPAEVDEPDGDYLYEQARDRRMED